MRVPVLLAALLGFATGAIAQTVVITDGNGGNNTQGRRVNQVVDGTVSGDVVGKRGVYGLTPAPTATATPTATPTSTPTPTNTPTATPTPA